MSAAAAALRELWALFVEDASLTIGIFLCLLIAAFTFPVLGIHPTWRGPVLFVLLAIVLWENVHRSATPLTPPTEPLHDGFSADSQ